MASRSTRPDVRNPLLSLPAMQRLAALPAECRDPITDALAEIAADARARAQSSWKRNKGPMAAYWKAVGAYASHARNAIRRGAVTV